MIEHDELKRIIDENQIEYVAAGFSGGHDSLVATHVSMSSGLVDTVFTIDTGIGIPDTLQFVKDQCAKHRWPLEVYAAAENVDAKGNPDPMIYDDIVMEMGFPGPAAHLIMYSKLKERQIRRLKRDKCPNGNILIITGARKEESKRRMGTVEQLDREGRRYWFSVIHDWTGEDCNKYIAKHGLDRNQVKDRICMSGECLCGAFAKPNELNEIEYWYPEVAQRIRDLEVKVRDAGHPWGWEEERPPEWHLKEKAGQLTMLCTSCEYKHELASDA